MATQQTSNDVGADLFVRLVPLAENGLPSFQYLRFDAAGWLWEAISFYPSGSAEYECSATEWPLSIGPLTQEDFEAEFSSKSMTRCTREEFELIKLLVKRYNAENIA